MSEIKDGGPAFPVPEHEYAPGLTVGQHEGMTLRDAMAISARLPDDYSLQWAEALVGERAPLPADGQAVPLPLYIDFWMRVEAEYRYRLADAMIAARSRP